MNVTIFGSCVTRDILEFQNSDKRDVVLDAYFARSSIGSSFSDGPFPDKYTERLESAFQQKIVRFDLDKTFPSFLSRITSDFLIIDFIDERFDLFETSEGRLCTISAEIISAGFYDSLPQGRIIKSGSSLFLDIWQRGWDKFIDTASRAGLLEKVLVNNVYWSTHQQGGVPFGLPKTMDTIQTANCFLDVIYRQVSRDLPRHNFLNIDRKNFVSNPGHRWGLSPYHYADAYYVAALARLNKISEDKKQPSEAESAHLTLERTLKKDAIKCLLIKRSASSIEFIVETDEVDVLYAFYVYIDGEKRLTQWYSTSNFVSVPLNEPGEYSVRYFVVDAGIAELGASIPNKKISGLFNSLRLT